MTILGLNGKISYSIIMGNEDNLFDVSTNGTVSNRMPLDREIKASHALTILASDQGLVNQLSSSAQVSSSQNGPTFICIFNNLIHWNVFT